MSRYSKMQAPPFWMWMFRIVGIACLVTLIAPTIYILKYSFFDHPNEVRIAKSTATTVPALTAPAIPSDTEWYIRSAEGTQSVAIRTLAVDRLGDLASNMPTLISFPVECLHAKLAIEQVAAQDPDPALRATAKATLLTVAEHGAVISRQ